MGKEFKVNQLGWVFDTDDGSVDVGSVPVSKERDKGLFKRVSLSDLEGLIRQTFGM